MDYKVGDWVLLKVKVAELDMPDKKATYNVQANGGGNWWVYNRDIIGLAPVEIPEGWTAASQKPEGAAFARNVQLLLDDGAKGFGWWSEVRKAWRWVGSEFREEMREIGYGTGVSSEPPSPVIAWRELPEPEPVNVAAAATTLPEGWTPADQPPVRLSCKLDEFRDVTVLFSNGKERTGWHDDCGPWFFYLKNSSQDDYKQAKPGKIIGWKELPGTLEADAKR